MLLADGVGDEMKYRVSAADGWMGRATTRIRMLLLSTATGYVGRATGCAAFVACKETE